MLIAQTVGHIYKVGESGVSRPKLIRKVEPQYTKEVQDKGVEGGTLLSVVIIRRTAASILRAPWFIPTMAT